MNEQHSTPNPETNPRKKRIKKILLLSSPFIILAIACICFLYWGYRQITLYKICPETMEGLLIATLVYEEENKALPPADKWCDILIEQCDVSYKSMLSPLSDTVEGECAYALNKHLYDVASNKLPGNIVFLFETDAGKEPGPRTGSLQDRDFYQQARDKTTFGSTKNTKVYPKRWNQTGGPEIAVTRHNNKCRVVLRDNTFKEVTLEELRTLRWTADDPHQPVAQKSSQ